MDMAKDSQPPLNAHLMGTLQTMSVTVWSTTFVKKGNELGKSTLIMDVSCLLVLTTSLIMRMRRKRIRVMMDVP